MMIKHRQKYDREFKKKAVELSIARGNAREVAEELDIPAGFWLQFQNQYVQDLETIIKSPQQSLE